MTLPHSNHPINRSITQYRQIEDLYCEKGLVSILFLACGRHNITDKCLSALLSSVSITNIEWIFLENQVYSKDGNLNLQLFFNVLKTKRGLLIYNSTNYGINNALNNMFNISRGEYCLIMENDWYTEQKDEKWLINAIAILEENPDVGIVQLRDIYDPCENWGYGKPEYLPFSCDGYYVTRELKNGYRYLVASNKFYGINNNPCLVRKSCRKELGNMKEPEVWSDLRHGESEYQERFIKTYWKVSHINMPVFRHAGNDIYKRRWKIY